MALVGNEKPITTGHVIELAIDFTSYIVGGETIVDAVITANEASEDGITIGTDVTAGMIEPTDFIINGNIITQNRVKGSGGESGKNYYVHIQAITSAAHKYKDSILLPIQDII